MLYHFTDANFQTEVLSSDFPVLVDFYADWCGPCKMMAPIVEKMADQYAGRIKFGKVNVDESLSIARTYSIMSIPTLLMFRNGQIVDQVTGVLPEGQLSVKLQKLL